MWEGSTPVVPVCVDVGRRVRALTGAATGKRTPLPVEALPFETRRVDSWRSRRNSIVLSV